MAEIIELGGKRFRVIEESTVEHDFTVIQLLADSGLDKFAQAEEESTADFSMRILRTVMVTGKSFDLLGAFLIPEDIPDLEWTPAIGLSTRKSISQITDAGDKILVRNAVVSMLLRFSMAGLFSWIASQKSSNEETIAPRQYEGVTELGRDLHRGATLFSRSRATRRGIWRWFVVRWRIVFSHTRNTSSEKPATSTK